MKYILMILMMMNQVVAFAAEPVKSVAASQMARLARAAVFAEVEAFNESLAVNGVVDGYNARLTQYLVNQGKTNIDPGFMLSKCTLSEENIGALLSDTLSSGDDALVARKNGLAAVKGNYNGKIWRLLSEICVHARDRFMERLSVATQNSRELLFSDQLIVETTQILFYPTDFGKATFRKVVANGFNALLSGAMVFGASGALIGIPVGGMVLAVVTVINGSRGVISQIKRQDPFNTKLKTDLQEVSIDLTEAELSI